MVVVLLLLLLVVVVAAAVVVVAVAVVVVVVEAIEYWGSKLNTLRLQSGHCSSECCPSRETLIQIAKSQEYEHSFFYREMLLGEPQKAF